MKKILVIIFTCLIFITSFGEDQYKHIASLNLSSDEMLTALVAPERIVGLSGKISEDKDMSNISEVAKNFPKIERNLETLLNLNPDLVVAADWIDSSYLQSIKDAGIDVYIYKTPKTYAEQKKIIIDLAKTIGEDKKGEEIVNEMDRRLKRVQDKIKAVAFGHKPKVMLYTVYETTSDENTSFNDLVNLIGGTNPVVSSGVNSFQKISKEKVIELDPDVIIVPVWSNNIDNDKFFDYLLKDLSFRDIKAVKNKKIYGIPYKKLSPTSQYMIGGIEEMAKVVYHLED